MTAKQLDDILSKLKDISILVLGDYFLDKYLLLDPAWNEKSIETGLTAYQAAGKKLSPGAAGTVVNNLCALGVGGITTIGAIGDDGEGYELMKSLRAAGVHTDAMVIDDQRFTPTYIKPVLIGEGGGSESNRIDIKNRTPTPRQAEDIIIERLRKLSNEVDAIIVIDQVTEENCGVVTERVRDALAVLGNEKRNLPIYADSRAFSYRFENIIVKCNQYELVRAFHPGFTGEPEEEMILECGAKLAARNGRPAFVTLGSRGQIVFDGDGAAAVPAVSVEGPLDICGAGDATTAGTVSALCCGASSRDAALLGNIVASITIQQLGTTGTASPQQVMERFGECSFKLER